MMKKIRQLLVVHYQSGSNGLNYLKSLREGWAFLDPNPDEVYNLTIGNVK